MSRLGSRPARTNVARLLGAIVVTGVVTGGGLQGAAHASPTDGTPTRADAGDAHISIEIPGGWKSVAPPPGLAAATVADMRRFFTENAEEWAALGIPADAIDRLSEAQLRKLAEQVVHDTVLIAADTAGDGDNVQVRKQDGPAFSSLAEWRAVAKASAHASKGKLLATGKTKVGNDIAFTSLERDPWEDGSTVYYGYMEIAQADGSVVAISLTVDGQSRRLAEAMLASVRSSE